jgi:dienelactone hydrolase
MNKNRRQILKLSGLTALGFSANINLHKASSLIPMNIEEVNLTEPKLSIIGKYGVWATELKDKQLPKFSFRNTKYSNVKAWQKVAINQLVDRMAIPEIGGLPNIKVIETLTYDGLSIEKLTWQLPYGRPTEAILLKPLNAKGKLPAVLGFHDHGGDKYFGTQKITKTSDNQHPLMKKAQQDYYGGAAWANELAKRGYVVLVSDAFAFGSRRVMMEDIPVHNREGLTDKEPENPDNIQAYNEWANHHEQTMSRSLFSAGTTWPGVFFAEDRKALDILCSREDVDKERVGCCGLSGGGLRSVFMGGLDSRIKCAVPVGFMTTWNDFALNKSFTHTWMTYVPLLPNELDFPEILGLRTPLPTLVLNDINDNLFTMPEMEKANNILKDIYKKAGAEDKYKCSFHPGPHKFDKKMQAEAFDWFDKWLK